VDLAQQIRGLDKVRTFAPEDGEREHPHTPMHRGEPAESGNPAKLTMRRPV